MSNQFPATVIKFSDAPAGLYLPADSSAKLAALLRSIKGASPEQQAAIDTVITAAQAPALAEFGVFTATPSRIFEATLEPETDDAQSENKAAAARPEARTAAKPRKR